MFNDSTTGNPPLYPYPETKTADPITHLLQEGSGEILVPKDDPVNHPSHYTYSSIEPIDVIEAWDLNFNLGNVIKYVARAPYKNSALQDLEKAKVYLEREIQRRKINS